MMDEYIVKCVRVSIANETFWFPARSKDEAIEDVKDMLARGLENTLEHRIDPVVDTTWFNYTVSKGGLLNEESDDRE